VYKYEQIERERERERKYELIRKEKTESWWWAGDDMLFYLILTKGPVGNQKWKNVKPRSAVQSLQLITISMSFQYFERWEAANSEARFRETESPCS
jgi:hypothetical protein